jgi:hypothetical protein
MVTLARKLMVADAAPSGGPFPYSFETKTVGGTVSGFGEELWDDPAIKWITLSVGAEADITVSASNATLGSNSWKMDTVGMFAYGPTVAPAVDLTGYSSLSLDVYIESIGGSDSVFLEVADVNFIDYLSTNTPPGDTGPFTLTIDLDLMTEAKDNVYINIVSGGVAYIDNLRVA